MTVSPFDHPLLSAILGDEETARQFSAESELAAMIAFERALAEAEAAEGIIDQAAADAIVPALARFSPDMAKLRAGVARDGLVVPELVRQLREAVGEPHGAKVHFGSTSQDVIDTALVLRLKPVVERFDRQLVELIGRFVAMSARFGSRKLTGVTRMQAAIPIHVSRPHRIVAAAAGASPAKAVGAIAAAAHRAVRRRCRHARKIRRQGAGVAQGRCWQARPRRCAAMAEPARQPCGVRRLAVAGHRHARQVRAGSGADGARRQGDCAGRRRRILGHAAQAQPCHHGGAGRAGALQRHAAFRHASRRWCTSRSGRAPTGRSNGCCCRRWWSQRPRRCGWRSS